MAFDIVSANWRRAIPAAVRLAALYVAGAGLLLMPFMLLPGGGFPVFRDLVGLAVPAAVLFVIAFVILAVARRAGFAALWLLLTALWTAMLAAYETRTDIVVGFIAWTVVAFPLHSMAALGIPSVIRVRLGRSSLSCAAAATLLWIVLAVPAAVVLSHTLVLGFPPETGPFVHRIASPVAPFLWAPAPFVIVLLSFAHVWTGMERHAEARRGENGSEVGSAIRGA